jgi:predicted DNA-binding antitoxin AbrB/MazE fold protein
LWSFALPFKEKIKEIEYGHGKSFTKNISKSSEIVDTIRGSIKSSIDEILILFSEYEVLIHSKNLGILKLLQEVTWRGIKVRIIVHCENKNIKDYLKGIFIENFPDVSLQYLQKSLQTKMTTMIFDRRTFLDISTDVTFDENSESVMGSSIYSNNEIKLNSLISIFEFLWIQSDIDNQKVIKEAYFKLFKGFNLRDETYKREWKFKVNKQKK